MKKLVVYGFIDQWVLRIIKLMESLALLGSNLLSPPVIAFGTGMVAIWSRSDLKFPEQIYQALTIYLLLAIGFKGGSALVVVEPSALVMPLLGTLLVGSLIPIGVFVVTRYRMKLSVSNAAALAAHYGSVSAVTFMACLAFLDRQGMEYESFMPAIMATMEIPAILVALLIAKRMDKSGSASMGKSLHEVISGRSFVLLGCGLLSGLVAGDEGRLLLKPFLVTPFYGVLMLFLLEMGLVAGEKVKAARQVGLPLVCFAILSPCVQGMFGLGIAYLVGFSQGGAVVFALLTVIPSLQKVIAAFLHAIPGLGGVIAVMMVFFFTAGVLASHLFGEAFPEWFGDLGTSLFSLFQIMTLESWSMGIVRPIMEVFPSAWMFFVPFIVIATFTILNLFIGIIVSTMQELNDLPPPHLKTPNTLEVLERIEADLKVLKKTISEEK